MRDFDTKVGILGIGGWGWNHLRTQANIVGPENVCVADLDPKRVDEAQEAFPTVQASTDPTDILQDPDIQAVTVATPAHTHADVTREVLEAGKDVLVEKPITLDPGSAQELVELAETQDRILMVGHLLLYQEALAEIRRQLEEGSIGDIISLHQVRRKLGTVRTAENALLSFGVHDIAVFLDLLGTKPTRVSSVGQCVFQEEIEDDVYLHLRFPEGVQAHLHTSWFWPEKERKLTVIGSEGMLTYDEVAGKLRIHRKGIDHALETWDEGTKVLWEGDDDPLRTEIEHFLTCVRQRVTPRSDGRQGVDVATILNRASQEMSQP